MYIFKHTVTYLEVFFYLNLSLLCTCNLFSDLMRRILKYVRCSLALSQPVAGSSHRQLPRATFLYITVLIASLKDCRNLPLGSSQGVLAAQACRQQPGNVTLYHSWHERHETRQMPLVLCLCV